ncbi:MAG: formate dehydrogenase accessory protein FdhE [Desulfosporosinus sp.]|nr:formate dehydrogenase accessory protein FdhE [Desulfosporosinus sp.]MBC2726088.1 formate dehydrogenase accessory protein FdhE [Desulfosporosinus sp.]
MLMDNAFQMYNLLKKEVKQWQSERGSFWTERLRPAQVPPYYPIKELPENAILELCQRLNQVSDTVVSDIELLETWKKFRAFQPVANAELLSRLQLALCGVAQAFRETMVKMDNSSVNSQVKNYVKFKSTQTMTCPICGEPAGVSVLSLPNGRRFLHCSICEHEWSAKRVGCIRCGTEEASKLNYLKSEEYPGAELVICQACGQYSKEYDLRVMNIEDVNWEAIRTLPLDYAAENWLSEHAHLLGKIQ